MKFKIVPMNTGFHVFAENNHKAIASFLSRGNAELFLAVKIEQDKIMQKSIDSNPDLYAGIFKAGLKALEIESENTLF